MLIEEATKLTPPDDSPSVKSQPNGDDFFHYSDDEGATPNATRDEITVEVTRYLLDKNPTLDMLHGYDHYQTAMLKHKPFQTKTNFASDQVHAVYFRPAT